MKAEHIIGTVAICLIVVLNFAIATGVAMDKMKRESLEGYRAIAIYETNSVGEVKIKQIDWKKP